jgi:hypothetical protein
MHEHMAVWLDLQVAAPSATPAAQVAFKRLSLLVAAVAVEHLHHHLSKRS